MPVDPHAVDVIIALWAAGEQTNWFAMVRKICECGQATTSKWGEPENVQREREKVINLFVRIHLLF